MSRCCNCSAIFGRSLLIWVRNCVLPGFPCRRQIKCRLLLPRETQRGHHRRQSEWSSGRLRPHSLLNVERLACNIRASRRPVLLWWGWQTKKGSSREGFCYKESDTRKAVDVSITPFGRKEMQWNYVRCQSQEQRNPPIKFQQTWSHCRQKLLPHFLPFLGSFYFTT